MDKLYISNNHLAVSLNFIFFFAHILLFQSIVDRPTTNFPFPVSSHPVSPFPSLPIFFFPSSVSHPPHPLSWMLEKLNKILYKLHCPGEPSPVVMTTQHWLLSIKFWEKGKGVKMYVCVCVWGGGGTEGF